MEAVRKRHPNHIPCRFEMPDHTELKLVVPKDSNAAWAMGAARKRWRGQSGSSDAFFMFCDDRMCMGTTKLLALDAASPQEIKFVIRKECTFGH